MSDDDPRNEESEALAQIDLQAVLRMLRRRRWIVVGVSFALLLPVVSYPLQLPNVYAAQATLEILAAPEVAELGPKFTMERRGSGRRRDPLGPVIALAKSDLVLGRVVDSLPPPSPREPRLRDRVTAWLGVNLDPAPLTPDQRRRGRIDGLRRALQFGEEGDGTVLTISAQAKDPDAVALIVNAVADAVVAHDRDEREAASRDAMSWLTTQIYDLREKIDRQVEAQSELVKRSGIRPAESTEGGNAEEAQDRAALEERLREARIDLLGVEQRLAELRPRFDPPTAPRRSAQEIATLRQEHADARAALMRARQSYTDAHPEVRRLQAIVNSLAEELGPDLSTELSEPTREQVAEYGRLSSEQSRLRGRVRILKEAVDQLADPDGSRSAALDQYEQRQREIEINRNMLSVLLERRNSTLLTSANEAETTRVRDYAVPPVEPAGPKRLRLWVLGSAAAFMLGLGAAVLRDLLDPTVREPGDVRRLLDLPVLGLVPNVLDGSSPEHQSDRPPGELSGESYRNLRAAILLSDRASESLSLMVTSAIASEGKTTTSCNLATCFAQAGHRVLLVDGDMRCPRVSSVFGLPAEPGLAELLRGDVGFETAVRRDVASNLDVIVAGEPPPNPSELLGSAELSKLLAWMKSSYSLVVIDAPALLGISDASLLGRQVEAALLVHRLGAVQRPALRQVRELLDRTAVPTLGLVFNRVDCTDRNQFPRYMDSPYASAASGHKGARRPGRSEVSE